MNDRIQGVVSDLSRQIEEARQHFTGVSARELNWKPAKNAWSAAQCFDHLITTHTLYFPLFERLNKHGYKPSLWERVSPLSGWWGSYLIRILSPQNPKKTKTTANAQPASSDIDANIIERYAEHQQQLIERIQALPVDLEFQNTIVTSPLLSLVTYSLDDVLTILVVHGSRHAQQAQRAIAPSRGEIGSRAS